MEGPLMAEAKSGGADDIVDVIEAVKNGDIQKVTEELERVRRSPKFSSVLFGAINSPSLPILKLLMENGGRMQLGARWRLLVYAIGHCRDISVVEYLLENMTDEELLVTDHTGSIPLHYAFHARRPIIVSLLMQRTPKEGHYRHNTVGDSPPMAFYSKSSVPVIIDEDQQSPYEALTSLPIELLSARNVCGHSAILLAAFREQAVMTPLLAVIPDTFDFSSVTDNSGITILHAMVQRQSEEGPNIAAFEELVQRVPKELLKAQDWMGQTPLFSACAAWNSDMACLLIAAMDPEDLCITTNDGQNAFHAICDLNTLECLLDRGPPEALAQIDSMHAPPLVYAASTLSVFTKDNKIGELERYDGLLHRMVKDTPQETLEGPDGNLGQWFDVLVYFIQRKTYRAFIALLERIPDDDLLLSRCDGNTLLHHAVGINSIGSHDLSVVTSEAIATLLMDRMPVEAKFAVNSQGHSPQVLGSYTPLAHLFLSAKAAMPNDS